MKAMINCAHSSKEAVLGPRQIMTVIVHCMEASHDTLSIAHVSFPVFFTRKVPPIRLSPHFPHITFSNLKCGSNFLAVVISLSLSLSILGLKKRSHFLTFCSSPPTHISSAEKTHCLSFEYSLPRSYFDTWRK